MHLLTVRDFPKRLNFIAEITFHLYFDFEKNAK